MTRFFNPYAHVQLTQDDSRRDEAPPGHAVHGDDLFSATLSITITAQTPILLPDQAGKRSVQGSADVVGMRTGPDGLPLVLGSSIKGMLRHYYETATNSRLGVVSSAHAARPLAIRRPATAAVQNPGTVTAIDRDDNGAVTAVHVNVVQDLYSKDDQDIDFQPGAWLPRELGNRFFGDATPLRERHGREVWALLHPLRSTRRNYCIWRASALGWSREEVDLSAPMWPRQNGDRALIKNVSPMVARAIVHWPTGGGLGHDERLVVQGVGDGQSGRVYRESITLGADAVRKWDALIESYRRAHENERDVSAYSGFVDPRADWSLRQGSTVWIENPDDPPRARLHPVMIGRDVFDLAPTEFVPPNHLPADGLDQLSPADRLFGWVSPHAEGMASPAYRSHFRVDPATVGRTDGGSVLASFAQGITLQALNSPKPSQYRFYLGERAGADTKPLPAGQAKGIEKGYASGGPAKRIVRGRKHYLHDKHLLAGSPLSKSYWSPKEAASQPHGSVIVDGVTRFREFTMAPGQPPAVSVRISGWIPAGTTIRTTLRLVNVSKADLIPLLALLTGDDEEHMRLGFGKPLGFGVVRVRLDNEQSSVESREQLLKRYSSLSTPPSHSGSEELNDLVDVAREWFSSSSAPAHVRQLRTIMHGASTSPVHYPRLPSGQSFGRTGETFRWWVENDRGGQGGGQRLAQPPLSDDTRGSLPYRPTL